MGLPGFLLCYLPNTFQHEQEVSNTVWHSKSFQSSHLPVMVTTAEEVVLVILKPITSLLVPYLTENVNILILF